MSALRCPKAWHGRVPRTRVGAAVRDVPSRAGLAPLAVCAAILVPIWARTLFGLPGPAAEERVGRWIFDAAFVLASLACFQVALTRPNQRLFAGPLGIGILSFAAGNAIYSLAPDLANVPVPSVSDPLWLAIYPLEYTSLLVLTRSRAGPVLLATRLDGLVGGLAVASAMACVSVPAATAGAAGAPFWERATSLAYPVADFVLLGVVVSAVGLAGWRIDRTWATLAAAVMAWEIADLLYLLSEDEWAGSLADSLVVTGAFGLAVAAAVSSEPSARPAKPSDRGLLVPVGFGMLALAVLVLGTSGGLTPVAAGLAGVSLALALLRMAMALRENRALLRVSRVEAITDPLTKLSNRRKLQLDLAEALAAGPASTPQVLILLDLNGFKLYNDCYGHAAGDILLARLGAALAGRVEGIGAAYRMGGDEFCVLAPAPPDVDEFAAECANALADHGEGFAITAARGAVAIPGERHDPHSALALADQRMYRDKTGSRLPVARQSASVLIAVLEERATNLAERMHAVNEIACAIAAEIGLEGEELEAVRYASVLHDIGKIAIPDATLEKPGPLSDAEWQLIRRHPLIGERILAAAPALARSARLVRSSHERVDGLGYPDGLSGVDIPLGSRIVLVANAYDAMTSERSYAEPRSVAEALAELRRCAGTQFDPAVVDALHRIMALRRGATDVDGRTAAMARF